MYIKILLEIWKEKLSKKLWVSREKGCHPKGSGQAWEVGPCKPQGVQKVKFQVLHMVWAIPSSSTFRAENVSRLAQEKNPWPCLQSKSLTWQGNTCLQPRKPATSWASLRSFTSRLRKVILPIYIALLRSYLEYSVQIWSLQHKNYVAMLELVQRIAPKLITKMKHLFVMTGWESWGCSAWRRGCWRDTSLLPFSTWRGLTRRLERNFSPGRTVKSWIKFKEDRFRYNIRKKFIILKNEILSKTTMVMTIIWEHFHITMHI